MTANLSNFLKMLAIVCVETYQMSITPSNNKYHVDSLLFSNDIQRINIKETRISLMNFQNEFTPQSL